MKRLFIFVLALGIAAAAPTPSAGSGDDVYTFDPVIVTARGYAAPQSDTPGSIGVVEEKEISLAPKGSIVDALQRIPGITRTGDSPWGQDISIRGLSGPSVVILVNGKRINTATDMNARLGFINPADVERIEVLKGPVSALYGSGSTGGVVNIITRKATFTDDIEVHGKLSGSGSTNPGGGSAYAGLSASGSRVWGFVSGSYRDYGDTFGGRESHVAHSDYMDKQGRAMLGLKPWDPLTVTFEYMQSEGDSIGIPGGISSMPDIARVRYPRSRFTFFAVDAELEVGGEYLKTLEADFYYTKNERRVRVDKILPESVNTYPNAYPEELRPSADHETYGGKLQATFEIDAHTLVAGIDFWTWSVESARWRSVFRKNGGPIAFSDTPTPDATQVSVGAFAEDNWKINNALTMNIGARLDYLNTEADPMYIVTPDAGQQTTSRKQEYGKTDEQDIGWHLHAGLTWKMTDAWSQSLLLASSYRAADIMERFKYISLGGTLASYGNPNLKPEQSYYAEYALRYNENPFKADLRLFANIVTNYIAEKRVSDTRIELDNVDDARIYGTELDLRWDFHEYWGVYGNVALLYGRDEQNDSALPDVAPATGTVGLDFRHPDGFWARLESNMIAPQRSTPDNVEGTKGVILLNATLGYTFNTGALKHDISVSLDNICDTRYYNYLAHQRGLRVWEPGFAAMVNYSVEF